nr:hypothetical protein [uncultured bacterium]
MPRPKKSTEASANSIKKTEEQKKKRVRRSYLYAVGRRKRSIARVRLFKKGEGKIIINEKNYKEYFPYFESQQIVTAPLKSIGKLNDFNFSIKVIGGGVHGQAEAVRHGIARVITLFDKELRKTIKPLGFLRRDPRRKERKKPGLKRARRAPQFSKR